MTSSKSKVLPAIVILLRIALAAIFLYAGYVKVRDPWQLFAASVESYKIVSSATAEIVAKTFPWLAIAAGVGLLIGRRLLPAAAIGSTLLLLVLNFLVWRAFVRGDDIDCGCFGPG